MQPFIEDSEKAIQVRIVERYIDWTPLQEVSPEANSFIRSLLENSVGARMTLTSALKHPWLQQYTPLYRYEDGQPIRINPGIPFDVPLPTTLVFDASRVDSVLSGDASMMDAAAVGGDVASQDLERLRLNSSSDLNGGAGVVVPQQVQPQQSQPQPLQPEARKLIRRSILIAQAREGQIILPEPPVRMQEVAAASAAADAEEGGAGAGQGPNTVKAADNNAKTDADGDVLINDATPTPSANGTNANNNVNGGAGAARKRRLDELAPVEEEEGERVDGQPSIESGGTGGGGDDEQDSPPAAKKGKIGRSVKGGNAAAATSAAPGATPARRSARNAQKK